MSLCLNDGDRSAGFVRVHVDDVVAGCKRCLADIEDSRQREREQIVHDKYQQKHRTWRWLGRWFGFTEPTVEDAWRWYRDGPEGLADPRWQVAFMYGRQEQHCERLLEAAQASRAKWMWVSDRAVHDCWIKRSKQPEPNHTEMST